VAVEEAVGGEACDRGACAGELIICSPHLLGMPASTKEGTTELGMSVPSVSSFASLAISLTVTILLLRFAAFWAG
jgi:hypothetical protein